MTEKSTYSPKSVVRPQSPVRRPVDSWDLQGLFPAPGMALAEPCGLPLTLRAEVKMDRTAALSFLAAVLTLLIRFYAARA